MADRSESDARQAARRAEHPIAVCAMRARQRLEALDPGRGHGGLGYVALLLRLQAVIPEERARIRAQRETA